MDEVDPPFRRLACVGVGLIGGSVALATRATWPGVRVTGIDRREVIQDALERGVLHDGSSDLAAAAEADLLVLAAPVARNVVLLREVSRIASPEAVITDVGSTKRGVVAEARRCGERRFVGGHPLAGGEQSGVSAARDDLFHGQPWILTPDEVTDPDAVDRLARFVRGLGARPVTLGDEEHDRLVALISHLPQLVATSLMHVVGTNVGASGLELSGPGLLDTTRLAASPGSVWTEICRVNADEIAQALDALIDLLNDVRGNLHASERLDALFDSAGAWRARLVQSASPQNRTTTFEQ